MLSDEAWCILEPVVEACRSGARFPRAICGTRSKRRSGGNRPARSGVRCAPMLSPWHLAAQLCICRSKLGEWKRLLAMARTRRELGHGALGQLHYPGTRQGGGWLERKTHRGEAQHAKG